MARKNEGLQSKIRASNPQAMYTHCLERRVNLIVVYTSGGATPPLAPAMRVGPVSERPKRHFTIYYYKGPMHGNLRGGKIFRSATG